MIVKIGGGGKSFKGLSDYLTHDPEAKSAERVAWTHTHNLANDHVPSAVDEMYWTAQNAELLKQEAGVRAGGRSMESPVKHISLNWAPDDKPTREHMIETTQKFLRHMNWQEHQALVVAHDDKAYQHVHVMLNVVHPETGLRLNDDFERRRAQAWALDYERQQGHIHCEQRLSNSEDREKAMPRNIWMAFQENEKEFQRTETIRSENQEIGFKEPDNPRNVEWKILKDIQRVERQEFFAQGKSQLSELRTSIYREVREEFRPRWAEYYDARKTGGEPEDLSALKAKIIADQTLVLEPRRDAACNELRDARDVRYRGILDAQQEARTELHRRQEFGLDNAPFLTGLAQKNEVRRDLEDKFGAAAHEVTTSQPDNDVAKGKENSVEENDSRDAAYATGVSGKVGRGFRAGAGSFLDSLFFDLTTLGGGSTDPKPRSDAEILRAAADETSKRQQHDLENHDEDARARQQVLYRE
jgi:hypothetical protein